MSDAHLRLSYEVQETKGAGAREMNVNGDTVLEGLDGGYL